jgi:hypothetical protein
MNCPLVFPVWSLDNVNQEPAKHWDVNFAMVYSPSFGQAVEVYDIVVTPFFKGAEVFPKVMLTMGSPRLPVHSCAVTKRLHNMKRKNNKPGFIIALALSRLFLLFFLFYFFNRDKISEVYIHRQYTDLNDGAFAADLLYFPYLVILFSVSQANPLRCAG